MNFLHHRWIQKTSTLFLLVLFIFIHAVKTFHTHDFAYASSSNNDKNACIIKASFACSICDFQIAKDSDAITQFVQVASPLHFVVRFYAYTFSSFNSFLKVSSGTDPPLA